MEVQDRATQEEARATRVGTIIDQELRRIKEGEILISRENTLGTIFFPSLLEHLNHFEYTLTKFNGIQCHVCAGSIHTCQNHPPMNLEERRKDSSNWSASYYECICEILCPCMVLCTI